MISCETNCPERRRFRTRIEEDEANVEALRGAAAHFQTIKTMNEVNPAVIDQECEDYSGHYRQFVDNVTEAFVTFCDGQVEALLERIDRNRENLGKLSLKQCRGAYLVEAPDEAEEWVCGAEPKQ